MLDRLVVVVAGPRYDEVYIFPTECVPEGYCSDCGQPVDGCDMPRYCNGCIVDHLGYPEDR
jgi:hypothetical protein